jgi:hypothetical protein
MIKIITAAAEDDSNHAIICNIKQDPITVIVDKLLILEVLN